MIGIFKHLRRVFSTKSLDDTISEVVTEAITKALDEQLPFIIEAELRKCFKEQPNKPLSEVGFNWALALALRDIWPDVPKREAVRWLREYIEVPYGHADYDWTAAAAAAIADEYTSEFGEVA